MKKRPLFLRMSLAALLCLSLCIVSARAQAQTVPAPTGGPWPSRLESRRCQRARRSDVGS